MQKHMIGDTYIEKVPTMMLCFFKASNLYCDLHFLVILYI